MDTMSLRFVAVPAFAAVVALGMSAAPATADDTQPGDFGNVANADRGNSAPGPHCHFVLPAGGNGSDFDMVLSGAAHQGHTETGLPTGVFEATACPE
jgi:hypothetical protein